MKTHNILLLLALLWFWWLLFCWSEAYAMDLDPQLELGLGYPAHNNRDWSDGNSVGYIGASVRIYKWKWMDLRATGQHISDPTTNDAGTTWFGGVIRFGGN